MSIEVAGNAGDYAATLKALVTALENTDNPDERKTLGHLLKAMLPDESQLTFNH